MPDTWNHRPAALARFRYMRRAWSRPAAYHLARLAHGARVSDRLASAAWLAAHGIPRGGAAPSLGFPGVKGRV